MLSFSIEDMDAAMQDIKSATSRRHTTHGIGTGANVHRSSRSHLVVQIFVVTDKGREERPIFFSLILSLIGQGIVTAR